MRVIVARAACLRVMPMYSGMSFAGINLLFAMLGSHLWEVVPNMVSARTRATTRHKLLGVNMARTVAARVA